MRAFGEKVAIPEDDLGRISEMFDPESSVGQLARELKRNGNVPVPTKRYCVSITGVMHANLFLMQKGELYALEEADIENWISQSLHFVPVS